jgi:hypothetical protein
MNDITITLVRVDTGNEGTFGRLFLAQSMLSPEPFPDELTCAEPPWRDNRPNVSCIPPGPYACVLAESPRYGLCPHLLGVPGRSHILMHSGNWAGDTEAGLHSDSQGCIHPGTGFAAAPPRPGMAPQKMVTASRSAFDRLMAGLERAGVKPGDTFRLEIIDATGQAGRGWDHGIR